MENVQINVMVRNLGVGQHKIHCPSFECRDRKKKNLRTLSVKVDPDGAVYYCHHCSLSGSDNYKEEREVTPMSVVKQLDEKPLTNNGRIGLSISRETNVSFSVGRPSRLKNPPGIFPAASAFST